MRPFLFALLTCAIVPPAASEGGGPTATLVAEGTGVSPVFIEGTRVELRAQAAGPDLVRLEIWDTGAGVLPVLLDACDVQAQEATCAREETRTEGGHIATGVRLLLGRATDAAGRSAEVETKYVYLHQGLLPAP